MDEFRERLRRLYAAVDETVEHDLSRVPGVVSESADATFFIQDFSGDLMPDKMSNLAHSAIALVAHLPDHLKRLARRLGRDPTEVDATIDKCSIILILIDLANREKHGPPRNRGRSGRGPKLHGLSRRLRLSSGGESGGGIVVQYTPAGPTVRGSGTASIVLTADVIDFNGASLGDLQSLLLEAVDIWEKLVDEWCPPNKRS